MRNIKKAAAFFMAVCLGTGLLAGCGSEKSTANTEGVSEAKEKKTFVFGDTTFNPEN